MLRLGLSQSKAQSRLQNNPRFVTAMGQQAKIKTLRTALRAEMEKHPSYPTMTPAQKDRWLSLAVRDALKFAARQNKNGK